MELPTYTNIWRIEKRLYKLYDFRLPMPLPVGQIAVFAAIAVPYIVVLKLIGLVVQPYPALALHTAARRAGLAGTRPVLEGKRLPELVISQVRYLGEPRTWCRMAPSRREGRDHGRSRRVWRQARPESAEVLSRSTLEQVALEQAIPVESAELATSPALEPLPVPAARGAAAGSGKSAAAGRLRPPRRAAEAASSRPGGPAALAPPAGERAQATAALRPRGAGPAAPLRLRRPAAPVPVPVPARSPPVVPVQVRAPAARSRRGRRWCRASAGGAGPRSGGAGQRPAAPADAAKGTAGPRGHARPRRGPARPAVAPRLPPPRAPPPPRQASPGQLGASGAGRPACAARRAPGGDRDQRVAAGRPLRVVERALGPSALPRRRLARPRRGRARRPSPWAARPAAARSGQGAAARGQIVPDRRARLHGRRRADGNYPDDGRGAGQPAHRPGSGARPQSGPRVARRAGQDGPGGDAGLRGRARERPGARQPADGATRG